MPLSDLYLFLKFFFHLSSRNNYFTVTYDSVGQGVLKIFQDFWQTSQISNSNWNSFDFQLTLRFFKGPLRHCKERSNLIGFIWYVKFYGKRPNSLLLMLDGIISISSFIAVPKQIGEGFGILLLSTLSPYSVSKKSPMEILPPLDPQVLTLLAFSIVRNSTSSRNSFLHL